ncbi:MULTISPECIES: hypothetical protein [Pseudomonas]|uniref:hypothetical protein n=1 Tax=Pseudomonas TaxID=286 RepID=UPI001C7ED341|nr:MULTISPECIES: hypothetical protein [Pseudomonas]MDG9927438.1 hypothetical protein [Pseudomonas sp. GD04042]MDH0482507.1 hypothetical protein [Pseudomonas sp. GD04015]MDH0602859.1 hypothetical protein [Pseudomonas sp. GD03869]
MGSDPDFVKLNEIKARFDDQTLDRILEACRKTRLRRAELVRQIVLDWLDESEAKATASTDAA